MREKKKQDKEKEAQSRPGREPVSPVYDPGEQLLRKGREGHIILSFSSHQSCGA